MNEVHGRWVDNDVWEIQSDGVHFNRAPHQALYECPQKKNPFFKGALYGGAATMIVWAVMVGMFWFARG